MNRRWSLDFDSISDRTLTYDGVYRYAMDSMRSLFVLLALATSS